MAKKLVALLLAVAMVMSFALVSHADEAEIVDGKFTTTRHITVELYDRGGTDPTTNAFAKYIQEGMLEAHNVEVEFVKVPRWTETEELNNLLAAQTAPDVCVTYSYATIQAYADMGGVTDLAPLLEEYKDQLPNLWNLLSDYNIYYDQDPETGTLWAIEALLAQNNRINTFIRQDWLDALGLEVPTTTEEFEAVLYAFKERADELPVDDASKVVPYSISYDVGWRAATLIESCIGSEVSDRDWYVNSYDDRKLTQNGTKEAVRLLNKWYNDGLLWDNFALYQSDTTVEDDNMKAGYVGAFTHNWDYPFRNGTDSVNANLQRNVGEDAKFVAIDPFTDSNGNHTKYLSDSVDRKVFFPMTNDEPLASLLYLDFISSAETIKYLQIGEEGINHEVLEDGAIKLLDVDSSSENYEAYHVNSDKNIDYTITNNGLNLGDEELTRKSLAYTYAEIDPELVEQADAIAKTDTIVPNKVSVGAIEAEASVGDTLTTKRNQVFNQAVVCSVEDFDSVWDEYMQEYLDAGGQDIMDERAEMWEKYYGDADMLPE